MTFTPTKEQRAILDAVSRGGTVIVQAGAGTGKTATLALIADTLPDAKILYVAFNKSAQLEAGQRMPRNVTARTAHSLAFAKFGRPRAKRLNGRQPAREVARILGAQPIALDEDRTIAAAQVASLARLTVTRFCYSADTEIAARHVALPQAELDDAQRAAIRARVLPLARKAWADVSAVTGSLKVEHDHYLKLWALSKPRLPFDVIMVDEAQDTNPVLESVIAAQTHAQVVLVGDSAQNLYAFRGSEDILGRFPGKTLYLQRSWRFGSVIAAQANRWLSELSTPLRLEGNPALESATGPLGAPDAILARTNGTALSEVVASLAQGRSVALMGGNSALLSLVEGLGHLSEGRRSYHPDLALFSDWQELREYSEDGGADLKPLIRLVETMGAAALTGALRALTPPERAEVIVSTVHKAKGLQWNDVRLACDFRTAAGTDDDPVPLSPAEVMLNYVAITRARRTLDLGPLG